MINVENLAFSFSDKPVLRDISFAVNQGDLFAVLGPNGTGKTTLINILTGKLEVQSGSVQVLGTQIRERFSNEVKKRIGVMREIQGLYTKMTGYEYLRLVAVLYDYPVSEIDSRIEYLCEKYKLTGEINRTIKKYSAGTKKKLEFCAAIIHEANVLFLDEPFESVDPQISYEIKKFLREYVREEEATVIITSHILDTIQNLCNRYIIIKDGFVAQADEIKKDMSPSLEARYMSVVGHVIEDEGSES